MNPFPQLLAECRTLFDTGSVAFLRWVGLRMRSSYDGLDDIPQALRPHYEILIKHGRVVWGCVAQVNNGMFMTGDIDLPGVTVYSADPYFDAEPQDLADIGRAAYALKGTEPYDRDLSDIALRMTDEFDMTTRLPMPPSLTDGRDVFIAATLFHRRRLPGGLLKMTLFPMVIAPELTEANMVLALPYWSEALCRDWGEPLAILLESTPINSTARQNAIAAEKGPARTEPYWDVNSTPVHITPAAIRAYRQVLVDANISEKNYLFVGIRPDGISKFIDVIIAYDRREEMCFDSGDIEVVIRRDQLNVLRGALVDFKDSLISKGFLIRLAGE